MHALSVTIISRIPKSVNIIIIVQSVSITTDDDVKKVLSEF